ncbi:flavin reductase family protein (plasmid) [Tistrella bauzanensis]|uniref:flavin reductase family protein n=1 Tax=Tistrella TaxID=171436 RepID=UPI0031F700E3
MTTPAAPQTTDTAFDPSDTRTFRRIAGHLASGVAVVTATDTDGHLHGLTLTSVTSLSLSPPLFLACLADSSETLGAVLRSGGFCINYLAQSQRAISDVFATKSGTKFSNVAHRIRPSGQVEIDGALAVIECTLHERLRAGDHSIVIGRPVAMHGGDDEPLIHFRGAYRRIGAPLPPTAA